MCVGARLFVPCYDREGVICVDTETGETIWEFTAGGAVDSPPTIHRGLAIFGARDGYVYAVTTADGELVWRFRAAPVDSLVMDEGRLSSAWPVHGSVLVVDDTAYFAAGRSSFVDGGIWVHGIDALTGRVKHKTTVHTQSPRPKLSPPESEPARKDKSTRQVRSRRPKSSTTTPDGLLNDVLHSDGSGIFIRQKGLSLDLKAQQGGKVLCTNYGFPSDSWMHRVSWTLGGKTSYKNPFGKPALWAIDRTTGETLAEYPLPAAPVFDGMIAANAKLYITLQNGEVVCFAAK